MNCPQCNGESIDQTSEFDMTLIEASEARHDFKYQDCGCLFQIIYHPIVAKIVEKGDSQEIVEHGL